MTALGTLATRLTRHSVVYGAGSASVLVFGFVQLMVLTRLLGLAEFGQLAILLVASTLLTVVYNLGTLQGSMRYVFGAAVAEDDDAPPDPEADEPPARDTRRALATAIVVTATISGTFTLAIVLAAPAVAGALLGDSSAAGAVVWMAVAAALGSVWRLVMFALRMERRPAAWALVNMLRPMLVIAAVVPLAALGGGISGVMAGVALGTLLAVLAALLATRRSWRFAVAWGDAVAILGRGWDFVPVVLGFWVLNGADILLLSRFVDETEVGIYRVASRVGALMAYAGSAFLMSWAPFKRTPIYFAVEQERGRGAAGGTVVMYFTVAMVGLVLTLAVAAGLLVRVAPPSYADAASLIPLVGLGFALLALFRLTFRLTSFPRKRLVLAVGTPALAAFYVALSLLTIPMWGTYGAAVSLVVVAGLGIGAMLARSQFGPSPLAIDWRRIGGAVALAGACLALAKGAEASPLAPLAPVFGVAALLAYPLLVVWLGVIPRGHVSVLRAMLRSVLPRREDGRWLASGLADLDDPDRVVLRGLVREGRRDDEIATALGMSRAAVLARLVMALRGLAGLGPVTDEDARIGAVLVADGPTAERDERARRLLDEGIDPLELDTMILTLQGLAKLPATAWDVAPRRRST